MKREKESLNDQLSQVKIELENSQVRLADVQMEELY